MGTRREAASWEEAEQRGPGWPSPSAGPAPQLTQAAGPRGPDVLTRQRGHRHQLPGGRGREAISKEPAQALVTRQLASARCCTSPLCLQLQDSGLWLMSCWNVAASGCTDQMWGLSWAVPGRECAWLPSSPSAGQTWESHHQGHPPGLPTPP